MELTNKAIFKEELTINDIQSAMESEETLF
jgi:hypothetical protein